MKKRIAMLSMLLSAQLFSQAIYEDERYVPETDPLVLEKLDEWQDQKFGLLMHWGTYSQWGIVESWSICPEDYGWCERTKGSDPSNYNQYVKDYEDLRKTFNPTKFDPTKWAKAAKDAGMKYMVFTTKHHDGFNMFDTKYSDYKITSPEVPFSKNPKANITKEVFDAFRKENMWIGAYFSKPDWHNKNYWDPYFPPFDRNVNYNPATYPEKWQKYVDFTHNQILELLTDYGSVDILWLDGGWVAKTPKEEIKQGYVAKFKENESENGFIKHRVVNQDIKMDELVVKARKKQPGLIVVDRAVHGKNQNYLTPENRVPEKTLPYPWESCITSGGGWSYTPDAKYLSGREGIHMLIDVVAKGGNLLLNVAPGPDGTWQQGAYDLLADYGAWLDVNGSAIYNTKPIAPFKEDNICMTQNKKENVFLFYMAKEGENTIPSEIIVKSINPKKGTKITLLGSKIKLKWEKLDEGFKVIIPEKLRNNLPCKEAWTLKIDKIIK
ncbi:alpha-L-fucosidase [Wenyingzhuangia marina]|uniref:alpha-L-fucosidase n=1 Tax=Wenyingzhuangia marina TaxID=1195760 RepID=A0A1M5UCH3_9FLAO|nr:alpha-L-fucosidase [Wenyingzhuangia marina]GGF68457.1 alpha-L-fucosidase [Wenyingzhuangia marina]SHH60608.1 alpha-L-fucosidase [Wenyingzhuangia marina]